MVAKSTVSKSKLTEVQMKNLEWLESVVEVSQGFQMMVESTTELSLTDLEDSIRILESLVFEAKELKEALEAESKSKVLLYLDWENCNYS